MHTFVLVLLALHALPGVFWAGSTLVFARGLAPSSSLVFSQLGAAGVAIASGAGLWALFHRGSAQGPADHVLAAGALAAVLAAVLQALVVAPAARRLAGAAPPDLRRLQARMTLGQRVAAPLLMVTVVCMVIARYS